MIAGWALITTGCLLAFAALVAIVTALDRRTDPRPPFTGPPQFGPPPEPPAGPLAPFPGDPPAERDWWPGPDAIARRHARDCDNLRHAAHLALDNLTATINTGEPS